MFVTHKAAVGWLAPIIFGLASGHLVAVAPAQESIEEVTPELRERAVAAMQNALSGQHRWVKVHAAEYLLNLQHQRREVENVFTVESNQYAQESEYRVGILRVLAQSSINDKQRKDCVRKIIDIFVDRSNPDCLHALEALAKLGVSTSTSSEFDTAVRAVINGPEEAMHAYAAWVLLNSGDSGAEAKLASMLASTNINEKLTAAYALRFRTVISGETRRLLQDAVQSEPVESSARVYLFSAAFVHTALQDPYADRQGSPYNQEIRRYAREGSADEKYEACNALSLAGEQADIPLLTAVLDDARNSVDTRISAASAICHIGRRVPLRLSQIDWAVIGIYGVGMIVIGWFFSSRNQTADDYMVGGRNMNPWAVGLSLLIISTISYIAVPGEMIKYGPMVLGQLVAYPFIVLIVGWLLIPYFMKLKVTSAYEILDSRFGPSVRLLGAAMFLSLRLVWMAVIVYATTIHVVAPLTGLDPRYAPVVSALMAIITIVYTAMGGIKAVVWADVVQSVILFLGAILCLIAVTIAMGGIDGWWPDRWVDTWSAPSFGFESDARISLGWIFLSGLCWYVCTAGADQMNIQRYLSTRDAKAARTAFITCMGADALITLFLAAVGLALLGYFQANPHMLPDGERLTDNADAAFPRFIVLGLPAGVSGLVIAGLFAAAMSNLAAGINSATSVITVDFVDRAPSGNHISTERNVRLAKWISVLVGAVVVGLSVLVSYIGGNLLEVAFKASNLLVVPLFILFFMAMFVPWATTVAAWLAAAASLGVSIVIAYWDVIVGTDKGPSFTWMMPLSLVTGITVGCLASLIPFTTMKKEGVSTLKSIAETGAET